jgi:hypothetical protein
MSQLVRLTYTTLAGDDLTLDIEVFSVKGAAEPDNFEVFPGLTHQFLDGSLSEQIAGGRRNIVVDFGPNLSAANRRKLVDFWLSETKSLDSLCGQPSPSTVMGAGGSLTASTVHYYKIVAFDAVGHGIASSEVSGTTDSEYKTVQINWTAISNARGYSIYRKVGAGGSYELFDYTTGVSYTDNGSMTAIRTETPPATATSIPMVNSGGTFSMNWVQDFEGARQLTLAFREAQINQTFPV